MNSYASEVELNHQVYPANEYMDGTCYRCGEWAAPVTFEELLVMPRKSKLHVGTSKRTIDKDTLYHREVWYECFVCPECGHHFSVPYSST